MDSLSARITAQRFETLKRGGYDPDQVDAHLRDMARQVESLELDMGAAATKITTLEKRIQGSQDADTVVQTAFLAAAETKAKMLEDAERKASEIISQAEQRAGRATGEPPSDVAESRSKAQDILVNAEQQGLASREQADGVMGEAQREAARILETARRQAIITVTGSRTEAEEQTRTARAELEHVTDMLRTLKAAIMDGLDHAVEQSDELKLILDESLADGLATLDVSDVAG